MPRFLGYDSVKCILEFMEANTRRQLVQQCSSLRTADKMATLHIASLSLDQNTIKMDNTKYTMKPTQNSVQLKIEEDDYVILEASTKSNKITVKDLANKLLGGKRKPIEVSSLTFNENVDLTSFPAKLRVKDLRDATKILDKAANILDYENFPLQLIEVRKNSNFDHPLVKSAEFLVVTGQSSITSLTSIQKSRIHLECCYFSDRDIQRFIDSCQSKEVGTHYTIGFLFREDVMRFALFLELSEDAEVKRNLDGGEFDGIYTFKMSETSELCMFVEEAGDSHEKYCQRGWVLNVKVQQKE